MAGLSARSALVAGAGLALLAAALAALLLSPQAGSRTGSYPGTRTSPHRAALGLSEWCSVRHLKSTRLRQADDPRQALAAVARSREPMLLTNTVAREWPAAREWNESFMAAHLPEVDVYAQADRTFITFHDDKPLEPLVVGKGWAEFNTKRTVPTREVFAPRRPAGQYLYFSSSIDLFAFTEPDNSTRTPRAYLEPLEPFLIAPSGQQTNLWLGAPGLVTHTHYDASWNLFVQLQGSKRFTLFPPGTPLYLYPCLHPHIGHSQVDILNVTADELRTLYPALLASPRPAAVVAVVGPGQVLSVPPYWLHHVETLAPSISVNTWSDAPSYLTTHAVYDLPIPLEAEWPQYKLLRQAGLFLRQLLEGLQYSPGRTVAMLLEQRYTPLLRSSRLLQGPAAGVRDECQPFAGNAAFPGAKLEAVVAMLAGIAPPSIRRLSALNYVEHVALLVTGPDAVFPFLRHCVAALGNVNPP